MKLLSRASTLICGLLILGVTSCQSSTPQQKPTTSKTKKTGCKSELRMMEDVEEVTYETHIKKIFEDNCISCHSGMYPPELTSYDKFKDDVDAIFEQVDTDAMPQGNPLDDADKELFELWQNNNFAEGKPVEDEDDEDDEDDKNDDKDDKDNDDDDDC